MLGDLDPLFLALFDFRVLAFELLLVCEADDVLVKLVEGALVVLLFLDDFVEVELDVE